MVLRIWQGMIVPLLVCGCSIVPSRDGFVSQHDLPLSKQRQKIAFLQKKLEMAEKEQRKAVTEVGRLGEELYTAELHLIQRQIADFENLLLQSQGDSKYRIRLPADRTQLFLKEREMLQQMMENGPPSAALEAQLVLDRILRFITEIDS